MTGSFHNRAFLRHEGVRMRQARIGQPELGTTCRTRDWLTPSLRATTAQIALCAAWALRLTFARWMEDAGIPRVRREVYRGHGKRDIGDVYERYEVSDYLKDDAAKMRAALGPQKLRVSQGGAA